ncbi:hypothetical protein O3G_MSEX013591 [Manduca sexta]|uniref:C3H1-type domain-containing protein n=1 Tax=Manduca sexta TaxID=7130 RepID=A0A921ZTK9_MANSE|nr:hypothetical protein O3G_MSEX013591 [Manduca sexta]
MMISITSTIHRKEVNGNHGDIHPPLPPNPPPPDSPPTFTSKKEIEDDDDDGDDEDYSELINTSDMSYHTSKSEEMVIDFKNSQPKEEKGKEGEEIMCRNFIRGTCNRGASCIFVHKVILSQLDKVYKFCNDFQNSGCKRRNCRFVHATVFERESFLRTAYLPPHAFSHLKENNNIQTPTPAEASPVNTFRAPDGNQPPPLKLDRSQLIITKTKKLRQSNDLNNKITLINSKAQRLWTVLTSIIKSACTNGHRYSNLNMQVLSKISIRSPQFTASDSTTEAVVKPEPIYWSQPDPDTNAYQLPVEMISSDTLQLIFG